MPKKLHEVLIDLAGIMVRVEGYKAQKHLNIGNNTVPDLWITKNGHKPIQLEVQTDGSQIVEKKEKCEKCHAIPWIVDGEGYNLDMTVNEILELLKEDFDSITKPGKELDGKKFSTTIKKKYWEQKMEQVKELGYFYEYKQDSKFWRKRFNKLIVPCDGTFLVGSVVHRVEVIEVIRRATSEFFEIPPPEIHTEKTWRLTCVLEGGK